MKAELKDSAWRHGPVTYRNLVVWTREAKEMVGWRWFAAIRDEGLALLAYTGPWSSERQVEAFEAVFASGG